MEGRGAWHSKALGKRCMCEKCRAAAKK